MRINHNLASLNTYRQLSSNSANGSKSLEKLSSGLRINKAGDDAAGLAISEKMRGQIRGLDQASSNAQNGISLLQTAEGALNETHSILQRMRELAVQSATDTNTSTDRGEIQKEVDQLAQEVTRISNTTEFNTQKLLNGAVNANGISSMTFQIGANAGQNLSLSISAMDAKTLGISRDVTTASIAAAGAVDVTGASVAVSFGASIVSGATATLSANATAQAGQWNAAATGITGTTLATTTSTSKYEGWKFTTTKSLGAGADVTAAVDNANKTITLNFSSDVAAAASTAAKINSALATQGITDIAATGDATAVTATVGAAQSQAGLGAGEVRLSLAGGTTEQAIVSNTATSVTFADPAKFKGLTLTFDGSLTAATAATVNIGQTLATATAFSAHAKVSDAVTAGGIDVSTQPAASSAIDTIQTAIETVSGERSKLGALQNRFEHTIANLGTSSENLTAAESRVRDVDMAREMMDFTKNNILSQAAQAMLAQANQQPQGVLQLLR